MDDDLDYAAGLNAGVIRFQRCAACSAAQTLTRVACAECGSTQLAWHTATGSGTVYATTIVTRAPNDTFKALTPYTLVLVDLDEGARVMGHAPPGVRIGERVRASVQMLAGALVLNFSIITSNA